MSKLTLNSNKRESPFLFLLKAISVVLDPLKAILLSSISSEMGSSIEDLSKQSYELPFYAVEKACGMNNTVTILLKDKEDDTFQ